MLTQIERFYPVKWAAGMLTDFVLDSPNKCACECSLTYALTLSLALGSENDGLEVIFETIYQKVSL